MRRHRRKLNYQTHWLGKILRHFLGSQERAYSFCLRSEQPCRGRASKGSRLLNEIKKPTGENIMTFWDMCFEEVRTKVNSEGTRSINYFDVDKMVVSKCSLLQKVEDRKGRILFEYIPPKKSRKPRKDKGITRNNTAS